MRVTLRVLAGPYTGREFTFDQHDTFLIGRADTAHLYLRKNKFFSRIIACWRSPRRAVSARSRSTNGDICEWTEVPEAFLNSGESHSRVARPSLKSKYSLSRQSRSVAWKLPR